MGNYLGQAILFLAGILIQIYTDTLSPSSQKKLLRILAVLLIAIALVWAGYQLALHEIASPAPVPGPAMTETPKTEAETKAPSPTKRAAVPTNSGGGSDGNVWINSHPTGAEVYIVPAAVSIYDLKIEDVQTPENLVGKAPLSLDLSPGSYYVLTLFSADLYTELGIELPTYSSPGYDQAFPSDGSLISSTSFTGGEYIKDLSRLYSLRVDSGQDEALISVIFPLPPEQRVSTMPFIYPTRETVASLPVSYNLNESGMRKAIGNDLTEYDLTDTVDSDMVDDMIEVLLRVGKVSLKTDTVRFIIQLNGFNASNFVVSIYQ